MGDRHVVVYLRSLNGFSISRLHKGAARSARKRSETAAMFLRGLEILDGRR